LRPQQVGLVLGVMMAVAALGGCKRQKPPPRTRIWVGPAHACSLQAIGDLECWGDNSKGQLGDGTKTSRSLPVTVASAGRPDEVALGAKHTCALTKGSVRCWGDDARGQLGKGLETLSGVTALAAGGDQTCVIDGAGVRCWGDDRLEPHEVAGLAGHATAIAVGEGFVCAALAPAGAVRCSGADDRGQAAGSKRVLVGASIVGLTAGAKHACAVIEDGSIRCWGANDRGQLGDGTKTDARDPAPVHSLPVAAEVHAGANHTCARLRDNTVACWGENAAHQLVDGTKEPSSKPQPLRGLVGVLELAVGGDSGCVRIAKGEVRCWGANQFGQLGDGTVIDHEVPMPIRSPSASNAPAK
jgi:alpha-tubulin suppressor-like RCC1 family protein